jgi:3-oxoacyl-[acyl-carrier protein] reductase
VVSDADRPTRPPDRLLEGKVALVTGGGSGIGAAIARRLATLGAAVGVHGRTVERVAETVEAIRADGGRAESVAADLRSLDACREAVEGCVGALGRLDVLVNNAAVTGPRAVTPVLELDDERLEEIVAVNLTAAIRCSQLAAREMDEGGVIVNVGSVAGYAAQPETIAYSATKAGLIGLTRALAIDLAKRGIRAVHVAPGAVETETNAAEGHLAERRTQAFARVTPWGRPGTPDEIARVVAFLCTSDAAFVTGSSIVIDGGFLAY